MADDASTSGAPHALVAFFDALSEDRRTWLATVCESQINGVAKIFSVAEVSAWLQNLLFPTVPLHRFGRLITLIAILDFELSPLALARLRAQAESMASRPNLATAAQKLDNVIPEVGQMIEKWRDLREHELDDASLWVYRDSMQHLGMVEQAKRLRPQG